MGQYIILLVWLLVFFLISWKNLRAGVYLTILFLPAYLLRPKILGIPTTVLELEIYILFLCSILKREWSVQKLKPLFLDKVFLIATGLFFFGAIFSSVFSSDIRISIGIFKGWFFDPFLFGITVFLIIRGMADIKNVLYSFCFSGVAVAVVGLFYRFFGNLTYDGRLKGFFLSPNHLAMYLCPCLFVAGYLFLTEKKRSWKIIWALNSIIISMTIYFTYSYGAWIGVVFGLITWAVLFLKGRMKTIGIIGLIVAIFLLTVLQLDSQKFRNLIESPRSPLQSRIMVWQAAIKIGNDNFFIGIGPGMFQKYYLDYQKYFIPYLEWAAPQPHNILLAFWIQNGIMGLFGFVLIIFWFFKKGFLINKINNEVCILLVLIMVCFLAHGLVDTTYWKNDLSLVFWVVIFLMAYLRQPVFIKN